MNELQKYYNFYELINDILHEVLYSEQVIKSISIIFDKDKAPASVLIVADNHRYEYNL